jgi:uncharacterized membrane protein
MIFVFAFLFLFTGVVHLVSPDTFVKVIPPIFPYPFAIAILSGILELGFAAGLTIKRTRRVTAWLIIGFLVAVLPVHVYMLLERETLFTAFPTWALILRFPIQGLLIWWAYHYAKRP